MARRKYRRPRRLSFAAASYLLVALFGVGTGWLHAQPGQPRMPSSPKATPEAARLTFDTLPCPSEDEYKRLAAIVKLEIPAGMVACDDPYHSKIAKALAFADRVQIQLAPDWAPDLHADLAKPLEYIGRMSRKLGIDLSQSTSIAYNKVSEKSIYLGGLFFGESPLEALAVLIHEGRHSSEFDAGHVLCRRGDIPKTSGGCDAELSTNSKKAGAYSYGAAFYAALGLYAPELSKPDRDYMLSLSLLTIGTRFNEQPENLAQAFDLIATLDDQGAVSLLHPFSREPTRLELPFLRVNERVERIEFSVRNNGLLLFTSDRRLFTWDDDNGFNRIYATTLPETFPIHDAARVRVPFEDYSYYNFLSAENQIYYYRYKAAAKAYELAPFPIFRRNTFIPEFSRLFMGLAARSIFLGTDGVFYVSPRWADELPFDPHKDLQVQGRRWIHGTGGVVYESLYGITDDGKLHYTKTDLLPPEGDGYYDIEVYSQHDSSLQSPGGRMGRKFIEGLGLRALLDNEGDLQIEHYAEGQRNFWRKENSGRVVDFAILRRQLVGKELLPNGERAAFASACSLHATVADPWFGVGMGLNAGGELVIGTGNPAAPCLVAGPQKYKELRLDNRRGHRQGRHEQERGAPVGEAPGHTNTQLWVTELGGEARALLPYNYK